MGTIEVPRPASFPATCDVVIIGGGIVGCASAFYLSRAGLRTIVLERRPALATLTTAVSQECFRAQFTEPESIRMMLESIAVYAEFAQEVGLAGLDIGLRQQGYLFLTGSDAGALKLAHCVGGQHRAGLRDVELLTSSEVRVRFPFVSPLVAGAAYRAKDGWLAVHEVVHGFARGSTASFLLQTEAIAIKRDHAGVCGVETQRGMVWTRCLVIAGGPFSGVLGRMAGVDLPLSVIRRQKVVVADVPEAPPQAPMVVDADTGVYWRPEVGGAAMGWATPEPPGEPLETVVADWTFPAVVLDAAARLVPLWEGVAEGLTRDQVFPSAGQYTCTPDNKPIIGPSWQVPGLYFNVGYSGHGIMGSPAGAKTLTRLIMHPEEDRGNPFSSVRAALSARPEIVEGIVL